MAVSEDRKMWFLNQGDSSLGCSIVADSQANHGPSRLGAGEIQCGFQDSFM